MDMELTKKEQRLYDKFRDLKKQAGLHSPSIFKLFDDFPEMKISVDACFLCNPYAYSLFSDELKKHDLGSYLKFYPPQNHEMAEKISDIIGINANNILVGNGAIQIIENLVSLLAGDGNVASLLPTFSTYYEMAGDNFVGYKLKKENDFELDIHDFIRFVNAGSYSGVVLVNPNNPTGTLLDPDDVVTIIENIPPSTYLILDESFIHFANSESSLESLTDEYENLVIIKSMSKDFGIAGIRLGYAIMNEELKQRILDRYGLCWNSNGLSYLFLKILTQKRIQNRYTKIREKYNRDRNDFYEKLQQIEGIKVYPSQSNFFIVETSFSAEILFAKLLFSHGIYTRLLNDKEGLEGNFLRIASKDRNENLKILKALKQIL